MAEDDNILDNIMLAKIAEAADQYDDMAKYMKEYMETEDSNAAIPEYRNLLSVAFKKVVETKKTALKVIRMYLQGAKETQATPGLIQKIEIFTQEVEGELKEVCLTVLHLAEYILGQIEPSLKHKDTWVFYMTMIADHYGHLADADAENREEYITKAMEAYTKAQDNRLSPAHSVQLGLALSFSVFYYEIKNEPDKARELAKKAFDDAIADVDHLDKDGSDIAVSLREKMTAWDGDPEEDRNDDHYDDDDNDED